MPRTALAVACVASVLSTGTHAFAQEGAGAPQTPADVARLLAARHDIIQLTPGTTVSLRIPDKPEMFPLLDGPSPALLLGLPSLLGPYQVSVRSYMFKPVGLTLKIFVPTIAVLDEDFMEITTVPEAALFFKKGTWFKGESYNAVLGFETTVRPARFLLLYTLEEKLGGWPYTEQIGLLDTPFTQKRTAEGKLDVGVNTQP